MGYGLAKRLQDWDDVWRRIVAAPAGWRYSGLIAGFCLYLAVYFFAYRYAMLFSQDMPSPLWLPDSVLLCALLRSPPKYWWLFVLGPLPLRLFSVAAEGIPLWFLLGTFAVDIAKGLLAASLLRRFMADPLRLETVDDCTRFGLIAVVLVPAFCALGGAALLTPLGLDYWPVWWQWFLGDATAHLVVTPVILCWVFASPWKGEPWTPERGAEAALLAVCILAAVFFAFWPDGASLAFTEARFYLPVPFAIWAAFRFGMPGASAAVAALASVATWSALHGQGPFVGREPEDVAFGLQNFLYLRSATLYIIAASVQQRRRAEQLLRESEQRFRSMADAAPVLLWTSGPDKMCDFFNQSWLNFTGRSMEQEAGHGWTKGVHPDDFQHCFSTYSNAFDARKSFDMEYRLCRHDGEYRWIFDIGVPRHDDAGRFVGYIGSAVDVSERRQAEDGNRVLAHMQRLAIMGELTAAIAHEVRQPLSAIKANVDAAERMLALPNPSLQEFREILADIRKDDQRADQVLSRIRDFLRKREPNMEVLCVNEMMQEAVRFVSGDAVRRRVEIRTELAQGLPPVRGDRIQLQQVLLNLIVNGMDAMENVRPLDRRLTLATRSGERWVEMSVADNGPGIPLVDLPRLFDTFFTTRSDGMGLGLAIAATIVTAHRGRIWAENKYSGGAVFRFALPPAPDAGGDAAS